MGALILVSSFTGNIYVHVAKDT